MYLHDDEVTTISKYFCNDSTKQELVNGGLKIHDLYHKNKPHIVAGWMYLAKYEALCKDLNNLTNMDLKDAYILLEIPEWSKKPIMLAPKYRKAIKEAYNAHGYETVPIPGFNDKEKEYPCDRIHLDYIYSKFMDCNTTEEVSNCYTELSQNIRLNRNLLDHVYKKKLAYILEQEKAYYEDLDMNN
jgi:hypothetical protein